MVFIPKVSPKRSREIVREIARASSPRGRFFVLLITASMIASFGLIANSAAVIIGAMLVSPLMTLIFGLALGMLRGNPRMLGRALLSDLWSHLRTRLILLTATGRGLAAERHIAPQARISETFRNLSMRHLEVGRIVVGGRACEALQSRTKRWSR